MTGKTVEVTCKCCPDEFLARVADRKEAGRSFAVSHAQLIGSNMAVVEAINH